MSKETEKVFKAFDEYTKIHGSPSSEEELNEMLHTFMQGYNSTLSGAERLTSATAKTADDYLELAEHADSMEEALRYAKKALKLEPDNLDAEVLAAALSTKDHFDRLKKLEKVVEHGNQLMRQAGYFDEEYIGEFWGFHQTRPYMRLRQAYADMLIDVCMFDAAVCECEDMLRLSENDNIGARYTLMHLYALLGAEEKALKLLEKYDEEGAMMLLPLSVIYYKKKNLTEALKYLKKIVKKNPDMKKFLRIAAVQGNPLPKNFMPSYYRPFTIDEINTTVFENDWLYMTAGMYFIWANKEINEKGRKPASKSSGNKRRK